MDTTKEQTRETSNSPWLKEVLVFCAAVRERWAEIKRLVLDFLKEIPHKSKEEMNRVIHKLTPLDYIFGLVSGALILSAVLVFLSGFCLLGYQAFLWLRDGNWTEFPLLAGFSYLFQGTPVQAWLNDPASWHGLHQVATWILENIPLSLTLIMDGAAMILTLSAMVATAIFLRYYQIRKL